MQNTTENITSAMPLPVTGFLRLAQIIGSPKSKAGEAEKANKQPALIPVSKSAWWAGVKSKRYPQPMKLSPRVTVWKVEDIRNLIESGSPK